MPNPLLWNPNFVQTRRVAIIVTPGPTGGSDNGEVGEPTAAGDTILYYRLPW